MRGWKAAATIIYALNVIMHILIVLVRPNALTIASLVCWSIALFANIMSWIMSAKQESSQC